MNQLNEIVNNISVIQTIGNTNISVTNIAYDSRKVSADTLFVAIRGYNSDGHTYINKAIELGAVSIVCEVLPVNIIDFHNILFIKVADSRLALAQIANAYYNFPTKDLKVYGITGTNGKTTSTFLMKAIWEAAGKKIAIIGTTGIFIGNRKIEATHTTPESLELFELFATIRDEGIENVVIEVSSHSLILNRVAGINFSGAIFTNLSHEHLDFHKTMDEYANAKKILFDGLDSNAIAVVNGDDDYADVMLSDSKAIKYKVTFNKINGNIICNNIKLNNESSSFDLIDENNKYSISTKLIGDFNIENAALVATLAIQSGIDFKFVYEGLANTIGAPGRMERYILNNQAIAVVDYAHTPDALKKALLTCKGLLNKQNKLIVLFGCGGDRDRSKRPEMGKIASEIADFTIVTSDNPRTEDPMSILVEVIGGITTNDYKTIIDRKEAIYFAIEKSRKGDIILIAGKGHEEYQIIGTEKHYFSDSNLIKEFI